MPKENIILAIIAVTLFLLTYFLENQLPFTIFQATVIIVLAIVPIGKWLISKKLAPKKD